MNDDIFDGLDNDTVSHIQNLQSMERDDMEDDEYVNVQLELSRILKEHGKLEEALKVLTRLDVIENEKLKSKVNLDIGRILIRMGRLAEAKKILISIEPNNRSIYAKAQGNIGFILKSQNKFNEALNAFNRIKHSDDKSSYARAQFNKGLLLGYKGDEKGSIDAYKKVKHSDNKSVYAIAQFNLAMISGNNEERADAIEILNNINEKDNPRIYSKAQYMLGMYYSRDNYEENALEAWKNVKYEDDRNSHLKAWSDIIDYYMKQKKYDSLRDSLSEASKSQYYKSAIIFKIINFAQKDSIKDLYSIFKLILKIVDKLTIDKTKNKEKSYPERKLAHYTATTTANLLLNSSNNNATSPFRLNTISNVNDPSEGVLLSQFLEDKEDLTYPIADFNESFHAFVGCFTFNHDSLNQFRLYGKENDKEASGVSLVFSQSFFKDQSFDWLSSSRLKLEDSEMIESFETAKKGSDNKVSRLPVMRCVYLDPVNGYIHLAQRNKLTFFNEFKDDKDIAQNEWIEYRNFMEKKTAEVEELLDILKKEYIEFIGCVESNVDEETIKEAKDLLDEILLPLQYLVKHYAFQEEQECRLIYITSLDQPEVNMVFGKFLYVDYEPCVKSHLDKVYIAPAAKKYLPYMVNLLCDRKAIDVKMSKNPYRQT